MKNLKFYLVLFSVCTIGNFYSKGQTPIAPTPPMGWMSWFPFIDKINEKIIKEVADSMASSGLRDAGYNLLQLDDGWMAKTRDAQGRQFADPIKFPNGMKNLADYVHAKGLKIGIYSSNGTNTCEGYPGSYGHEEIDANTYASWGIDYLKYDACGGKGGSSDKDLDTKMSNALKATGRPILFNLCIFSSGDTHLWGGAIADMWRTGGDIVKDIGTTPPVTYLNWRGNLNQVLGKESYSGNGKWNDPDNLIVDYPRNNQQTYEEQKAQFCFWSLIAAPLMLGNDVRKMSVETKSILLNKEVIGISQNKLSKQGLRVFSDANSDIWVKQMDDGSKVVILYNNQKVSSKLSLKFLDVLLWGKIDVRDVWTHSDKGSFSDSYSTIVQPHGVAMLKLKGSESNKCSNSVMQNIAVTASGQCATSEEAKYAVDGNSKTKWCHSSSQDPWLQVDFPQTKEICNYQILHAGSEGPSFITNSFKFQTLQNGKWITADSVVNNVDNFTSRNIAPVTA